MTRYRNGHGEYDECRIMCMGVMGFKNVGIKCGETGCWK